MVGALTKGRVIAIYSRHMECTHQFWPVYGTDTTNISGNYATVAAIFLFQGAYSIGWTPLLYLYPPEVMNYSIRSNGMGVFQFALNATA